MQNARARFVNGGARCVQAVKPDALVLMARRQRNRKSACAVAVVCFTPALIVSRMVMSRAAKREGRYGRGAPLRAAARAERNAK